jgi:pimeloyl-ACP methyl ester carboxylesterase
MARPTGGAFRPFKSDAARGRYLAHYEATEKRWPIHSECRTVETEWGSTFMRISGPPTSPPLVLLPGSTVNSLCWLAMIASLSSRFRTFALDAMYDAGRSVPSRPIPRMADRTAWLDGLFDELGLQDGVNLMGLSYGGCVAAQYCLHAPERLDKSVWMSPAMTVAPIGKGFLLHLMPAVVPTRAGLASFTKWLMPEMRKTKRAEFESLVDELYLARKCYGPLAMTNEDLVLTDEQLRGIDVPVLYIIGDEDGVCDDPSGAAGRLNEVAPQIETELIPGGGHDMVMTRADAVSRRILQFLEA